MPNEVYILLITVYVIFLRSTTKYIMVAKAIFAVRGPEKRKGDLSYICLHEIKDKQLSIIYFGILYDPKILFTYVHNTN